MTITFRRSVRTGYSRAPSSGVNFCKGREDDAAGRPVEQFAQMVSVLGLQRRLAQQVLAHAESREQLVVEIVAVGQDHKGRVFHRRMLDDHAGVEGHQQALARALGMPDDADLRSPPSARVAAKVRTTAAHGVELVIARDDLDDVAPGVAEDDEVLEEFEEPARLEHALEHCFQFGHALRREIVAGHGAPRHEPLAIRGQRTDPRRDDHRK